MEHFSCYEPQAIDINTIICLDTEVSSYWINQKGNVLEYFPEVSDYIYNEKWLKGSCLYIWMIGINDKVYYGRDIYELYDFLQVIEGDIQGDCAYIYVHNLAYEFQFLRNILDITDVFARQIRKPMKFRSGKFIFRCSYMLTGLSLATWGKQVGVPKMVGDLDYTILRTPYTYLTDKELAYCEHDILVMQAGLKKYLNQYGSIKDIPTTKTGEVRKVIKDMYKRAKGYHKWVTSMVPQSVDMYFRLRNVFSGGDTHANRANAGRIITAAENNDIGHMDLTSSYIECELEELPMGRFYKIYNYDKIDPEHYCYMMDVRLTNVKAKYDISYIARSHCVSVSGGRYDNGRVISADSIVACISEIDLDLIKFYYTFTIQYIEVYEAPKGYMDKDFVLYLAELFKNKSLLKGVTSPDGSIEELYMRDKGRLNCTFGMSVTDIIQPTIEYKGTDWSTEPYNDAEVNNTLIELRNHPHKNILAYQWGVWVAKKGKANLHSMLKKFILEAGNADDILYYDTDSIFFTNKSKYIDLFAAENEIIKEKVKKCLRFYDLPEDTFEHISPNGKYNFIGIWDAEDDLKEFITLGAKKYAYKEFDDSLHITVSGVPKSGAVCLKSLADFRDGFVFDKNIIKKGLSTYLDGTNPEVTLPDGYRVTQPYGINIRNIGYKLGLTEEYNELIDYLEDRGYIDEK